MFSSKAAVQRRELKVSRLSSYVKKGGGNPGRHTVRVYHKKSPGGRIGMTAAIPAGTVLSLEVSVVAAISLSFDSGF